MEINEITSKVIKAALKVHDELGLGQATMEEFRVQKKAEQINLRLTISSCKCKLSKLSSLNQYR